MAEPFRIRIDLNQVEEKLAQARDYAEEPEIRSWLAEEGFVDQGDVWWLCKEITLEVLDSAEILEIRRM